MSDIGTCIGLAKSIEYFNLRWIKILPVHHHSVLIMIIMLVCDVKGCRYELGGSLVRVIQVPHLAVNTTDHFEYQGPTW